MTSKTVLILGATGDVGRAIASKFAQHGVRLVLAAKDIDLLERLKADIEVRYSSQVSVIHLNVDDQASIVNLNIGKDQRIDICVCTIGWLGNQDEAQKDSREAWKIAQRNYIGPLMVLEKIALHFEERGRGQLVVITSVAGDRGRMSNYHYGAAKAALSTYVSGLRNRLHHTGVSVTEVRPGFINTKMTAHLDLPPLLTASAQEVAQKVVNSVTKGHHVVYVKPIWRIIMIIIKSIPENVFKRLKM